MPTPTTTPARHCKQHKSGRRRRTPCSNWPRTGNSVHDRSGRRQLHPVPISRDHREESGGSCARLSTGGQSPPCSMRHTALAPLADFPPAANKASRRVAPQWNPHNPRGALWDAPGSCSLLRLLGARGIRLPWSALRGEKSPAMLARQSWCGRPSLHRRRKKEPGLVAQAFIAAGKKKPGLVASSSTQEKKKPGLVKVAARFPPT
jgi:hypothetical protein